MSGGVYKQPIAREGGGKRGGYRTIVLLKRGERAFFMYGFAKNERDNIDDNELVDFRELASVYLAYNTEDIDTAVDAGKFFEI